MSHFPDKPIRQENPVAKQLLALPEGHWNYITDMLGKQSSSVLPRCREQVKVANQTK